MDRRTFVAATGGLLAMLSSPARAQAKLPVIGILALDPKPSPFVTGLLEALRQRGLVAGRDFRVEERVTPEGYGDYANNAAELVRAKVDVIVTNGSTAAVAAAKVTKEIPIVMLGGADPVAIGLVPSLSRPGGNVTGVYSLATALNGKRVELLKELNPSLTAFGALLAPNVGNPGYMRDIEEAARALNLKVHFAQVRTPQDIEGATADLAKLGVGALFIASSTMFNSQSVHITEVVAKHRLPAVYSGQRFIDAGGLMIYSPSGRKNHARLAGYVERVLKGARPGELAIEQSSDVDLTVNLRTARTLAITIPSRILVRADRVIE